MLKKQTVTGLKTFSHIHCLVCQPQTHSHHHQIPDSAFFAVEVLRIHVSFHLVLACWRIDRKTMRPEFREIIYNKDTLGAEETSMPKKDKQCD
jgi:hypothetical protein